MVTRSLTNKGFVSNLLSSVILMIALLANVAAVNSGVRMRIMSDRKEKLTAAAYYQIEELLNLTFSDPLLAPLGTHAISAQYTMQWNVVETPFNQLKTINLTASDTSRTPAVVITVKAYKYHDL